MDSNELNTLTHFLSKQELDTLLSQNQTIDFSAGAPLLQQGKKSAGIYLVLQGAVTVTARIMGDGVTSMETLGPGYFLGEVNFIEDSPCTTSIVANGPVQCLFITQAYFELLSAYFPEIKYKLMSAIAKQLCARLKQVHDKVADFVVHSEMTSLSFFGKIAYSLTSPKQMPFIESEINTEVLQKKFLFNAFTKDEFSELINRAVCLKAAKHCKLIHEDEKNASCYIIIQGAVQASIVQDSKVAKLSVMGPLTLFASVACVDSESALTITFITCEQAILLELPEKELQYLQKHNPALWYKLFNLICASLIALKKSIDKLDIRLHIETYNR